MFERAIKLGVIESHREVTGDGFDQFDVITGQKISEAKNRYGVLADAAGDKVVEVELLERAANGVRDISCRTGRLEKERPAGQLGPGRLEETEIQ